MKYNINKFQQGGGFATFIPVTYSQPVVSDDSSKSTTKSTKKSISSVLDDETFKELISKGGLTNDVNSLVEELVKLESSSEFPYSDQGVRYTSLKMIGKINELKESKESWNTAFQTSKQEGGLNEVAVDSYGYMYIKDDDGVIKQISADKLAKSKKQSNVLTVAELLNERRLNPQLVGKDAIFNVAENSVGIAKITDHVRSIINSLGTESTSETKYISKEQVAERLKSISGKKPSNEEIDSIRQLSSLYNTPGDLFKITTENSTQRKYASKALDYIWRTLGQSAQIKLTATAALNGVSNPKEFLVDMLFSHTSEKNTIATSPETLPGSKDQSNVDMGNITPFELLHNGKTGDKPIVWNDPATNLKMTLHTTGTNKLTTVDGKPIGMSTINGILKTEIGSLVNSGEAYYGDKKISISDLNNIVYDGQTAARVMMPVTDTGAPNYDLLKKFSEVQKEVLDHKNDWSIERAQDEFRKRGFNNVQIGKDFMAKPTTTVKPFLLMYGYTAEGAKVTDNNSKIKALSSSEQDEVSKEINAVWDIEKVKKPTGWFDWSTTYYKGAIAIPYNEDSSIYAASIAKHIKNPNTSLQDARINMETSKGTFINASSSLIE